MPDNLATHRTKVDIERGSNVIITSQYNSPFGDIEPIERTITTEGATTSFESITITSGRGPKTYSGTMCNHSIQKTQFVNISGTKTDSNLDFTDSEPPYEVKKGSLKTTITGSILTPISEFSLDGLDADSYRRSLDDCIRETMKRQIQTGGFGKPPGQVGLGETLGEIGLSSKRLTETLLNLSPPIPRPPGRWDMWTPDEIADFRSWKDVFHPLEILFGLYPVAEQVTELALNAADKAQGYSQKMEKWVKKLKRSSSKFRATVKQLEAVVENRDLKPSDYYGMQEKKRKTSMKSWITGTMSCTDITEFTIPYDIITYYNENWAITMWDLTSYSYLFDRFTGGAVKKMLKAAIKASNSTSASGLKKNETVIQIYNVQVHTKTDVNGKWQASCLGNNGGTGDSRQYVYTRSWPDEIGGISEDANPAKGIVDLFSIKPPPLNGWTPTQYLDVMMLFIPPIVLKSS